MSDLFTPNGVFPIPELPFDAIRRSLYSTQSFELRTLDYLFALTIGYCWAKNMSRRTGGDKDYPIGARSVVTPSSAKKLHDTEPNWNGYCKSSVNDRISPTAFREVPEFTKRWESTGDIIDRVGIGFTVNHDPSCPAEMKVTAFHPGVFYGVQGPTHLVAAVRACVAAYFGPTAPYCMDPIQMEVA